LNIRADSSCASKLLYSATAICDYDAKGAVDLGGHFVSFTVSYTCVNYEALC